MLCFTRFAVSGFVSVPVWVTTSFHYHTNHQDEKFTALWQEATGVKPTMLFQFQHRLTPLWVCSPVSTLIISKLQAAVLTFLFLFLILDLFIACCFLWCFIFCCMGVAVCEMSSETILSVTHQLCLLFYYGFSPHNLLRLNQCCSFRKKTSWNYEEKHFPILLNPVL